MTANSLLLLFPEQPTDLRSRSIALLPVGLRRVSFERPSCSRCARACDWTAGSYTRLRPSFRPLVTLGRRMANTHPYLSGRAAHLIQCRRLSTLASTCLTRAEDAACSGPAPWPSHVCTSSLDYSGALPFANVNFCVRLRHPMCSKAVQVKSAHSVPTGRFDAPQLVRYEATGQAGTSATTSETR